MLMSAMSYSDLFLFLLLKMFDVYQTMAGEVQLHTPACSSGLIWASPAVGLLQTQGWCHSGDNRARQGLLAALVLAERGFPLA